MFTSLLTDFSHLSVHSCRMLCPFYSILLLIVVFLSLRCAWFSYFLTFVCFFDWILFWWNTLSLQSYSPFISTPYFSYHTLLSPLLYSLCSRKLTFFITFKFFLCLFFTFFPYFLPHNILAFFASQTTPKITAFLILFIPPLLLLLLSLCVCHPLIQLFKLLRTDGMKIRWLTTPEYQKGDSNLK